MRHVPRVPVPLPNVQVRRSPSVSEPFDAGTVLNLHRFIHVSLNNWLRRLPPEVVMFAPGPEYIRDPVRSGRKGRKSSRLKARLSYEHSDERYWRLVPRGEQRPPMVEGPRGTVEAGAASVGVPTKQEPVANPMQQPAESTTTQTAAPSRQIRSFMET